MDMKKYLGSAFLTVADIKVSGPRRVTITDVSEGRYDKPNLTFDDGTRLGCNVTNCRILAKAYGRSSADWLDKEVELVVGEIEYQRKPQEAVLVKPISPPIEKRASPIDEDLNDELPPF
jgi:hypothetical protein